MRWFLFALLVFSVFTLAHGEEDHGRVDALVPPNVELQAMQDSNGGWNLHLITSNFVFAPENAGGQNFDGQGHAHLYVDGEKIGRVYSDWYYLSALTPGEHELTVTLNTNDHSDYYFEGKPIQSSILVLETFDARSMHASSDVVVQKDDISFAISHILALGLGAVIGLGVAFYFFKKSGE